LVSGSVAPRRTSASQCRSRSYGEGWSVGFFKRKTAYEIWLSAISTWEALTLYAKGKIRLQGDLSEWVAEATAPLREAPLTHEIALAAQQLTLPNPDPADRFIAATAKLLRLTLVTADAKLLGLGEISTLANR